MTLLRESLRLTFVFCLLTVASVSAQKSNDGSSGAVKKLVRAAQTGNWNAVQKALDSGLDINAQTAAGMTALHAAKIGRYEDLVERLIEKGADDSIPLPALATLVDHRLDQITADSAALVLVVTQEGKPILERSFGYADIKNKKKADGDTLFRIGSVTKQFTAAAILKLQEAGQLSVDDQLADHFPDFPQGDIVTIRHLLNHTSGIHSYTSEPGFALGVLQEVQIPELIKDIAKYEYDFKPGERYEYSNSGYLLLGRIVELVSGKSYREFLTDEFFTPIGMTRSGVYDHEAEYTNESKGYSYLNDKFQNAKPWHMSWAAGAGAIYSTANDLVRWNEALFGGKVLNAESLKQAFTPGKVTSDTESNYGFGWIIAEQQGLSTIWHNGGLDGFLSHLSRYPDQNVNIIALTNSAPAGPQLSPDETSRFLRDLCLWEHMEARQMKSVDDKVDVAKLKLLEGRYDLGGGIITISLKEDQCYAQLTGQGPIEVFPKSENVLFARVVDAELEFISDDSGKITHAVLHQNGASRKAPRLGDAQPAAEISDEIRQSFVGKYDYGPLGTLQNKLEDGKLMAKLTGQQFLEVTPVSDNELSWVDVNAQLKFERDDDGKIINTVHHQGGQQLPVKKI